MAGSPDACAACRALISAFSTNVMPVSATGPTPAASCAIRSNPRPSSSAAISASLPGLPVATIQRSGIATAPQGLRLRLERPADAALGEREKPVQFAAVKGVPLGGTLDLDVAARLVHDHVHVRLRLGVLRIVEVEHWDAAIDADGHRGDLTVYRVALEVAPLQLLRR